MSKVLKSGMKQAHTSEITFAKIMSVPERVKRSLANTSFLSTFHRQKPKVQEQIATLDNTFWSDGKDPSSLPGHRVKPTPDSLSMYFKHPKLCA